LWKDFGVVERNNSSKKPQFSMNYFFPQLERAFPQLVGGKKMSCGKSCGRVVEKLWN
jgi:hypothetical protein